MVDHPDDQVPGPHHHEAAEGGAGVPSAAGQGDGSATDESSALGASAPQAEVVSLADAKRRRASGSAGGSSSSPPSPPEGGAAPAEGKGGGGGKRGKTIDWGHFNVLLANFALIYGTDTVWDGQNRLIMKISNMAHAHGSDLVKLWKASSERRTVMPQDVVFDPTATCGEHCVNLFGGFELEPKEGDIEPFLELARFLTSKASADADECDNIMHWLLCWLAYPLQHPGAKLRTAVIMHGDEGAGKNFLFESVLEIYGRYGRLVGQDELEDKFNDWRSAACLVVGDEVSSRQELVHNKNRLKALITSPTVMINPKNLPRREERNHINVVFLSNELQPLALDNSDRRYLVVYTPRMRERPFYEKLKAWKAGGGVAALYHYLLHYDTADFDPFSPAPLTQAKMDLIDLNLKSPERFWIEWAGGELDLPYRTCSTAQAYRAYTKYSQRIGDRFPLQRNVFTRMVVRISEARAEVMSEPGTRIVRPAKDWRASWSDPNDPTGARRTTRMLLVTEIPPDVPSAGDWARECVEAFEPLLKDYIGFSRSLDGDGSGGKKEGDP